MAAVAGVGPDVVRMACAARGRPALAVIDREGVTPAELGGLPAGRAVAVGAPRAERACVKSRVGVAGDALLGCALEAAVGVAVRALDALVLAGERERGFGVIEGGVGPGARVVTARAVGPELPFVCVVVPVALDALLWCALEAAVGMAVRALDALVLAGERERGFGVIEGGVGPGARVVAARAVGPELPFVCVVVPVALDALLWCALEAAVGVAVRALDALVLAGERERGFGVIEGGVGPGARVVAARAVGPELPFVCVVVPVALDALLWCALEAAVGMAVCAFYALVLAGERERGFGVIEGGVGPGARVVAARAVGP